MITIIWQLHNFDIAGFGNMTIICTTKKNDIFLYQFISSVNEYWILAHSTCFGTLQFSTNCRAGVGRSSRIPLHQRGRRVAGFWFLSAFIEKPLLQDSNMAWVHQNNNIKLFCGDPSFHFEWSLKMGNVSGRRPKLYCFFHESYESCILLMTLSMHLYTNKKWNKLANVFSSQPFHLALLSIGLFVTIGFFYKKFSHCTW